MKQAPRVVGNAKTLYYTSIDSRHRATANVKRDTANVQPSHISGLAICQYENENGFYLFGCDTLWNTITDTWHQSIEEAKDQAEFEYEGISNTWETDLGGWVYCQDCKRCYLTGEERLVDGVLYCAYSDCKYGDLHDALEWSPLRKIRSYLPEHPERNKQYSLI